MTVPTQLADIAPEYQGVWCEWGDGCKATVVVSVLVENEAVDYCREHGEMALVFELVGDDRKIVDDAAGRKRLVTKLIDAANSWPEGVVDEPDLRNYWTLVVSKVAKDPSFLV